MAAVTGYVLFEDVISGAAITTTHVTSAATLIATIAAGHMFGAQLWSGRFIAAAGLAVVFLAGTVYIVTMSGARNVETAQVKALAIKSANTQRNSALISLRKNESMLEEERAKHATECRTGRGKNCDGIKESIDVYEAAVKGTKKTIADLGPERVANAIYIHASKVFAAIPGAKETPEAIEARLSLLLPYILVFVVEIATLTFFAIALGHKSVPNPATVGIKPAVKQKDAAPSAKKPERDPTPAPPTTKRGRKKDPKIIDFGAKFRERHGRAPTGSEIRAQFPNIPTSTAYDYARAV